MRETDLDRILWPAARLGEAIELLARQRGLCRASATGITFPARSALHDDRALTSWLSGVGLHLGVEIRPAAISYGELDAFLTQAAPLLIRISSSREPRFIALVNSRRGRLFLLRPDLEVERFPATTITTVLRGPVEAPLRKQVERLIAMAKLAERDCHRAEQALFAELGPARVSGVWTFRAASGAPFWAELKGIGCPVRVAGLASFHAAQYLLWIGSWWLIGRAALEGRLDAGWLIAWALLLATLVPFQAVSTWLEGSLSIDLGRLLMLCDALSVIDRGCLATFIPQKLPKSITESDKHNVTH
jgi:ATP-binding cassette subfamily B protein